MNLVDLCEMQMENVLRKHSRKEHFLYLLLYHIESIPVNFNSLKLRCANLKTHNI